MTSADQGYRDAQSGFEAACLAAPEKLVERAYEIAGRVMRLRVVGQALADEIHSPLQHLAASDLNEEHASLSVDLWDSEATGIAPVLGTLDTPAGPYGNVKITADGRYCGEQRDHAASWFDRTENRIVGSSVGVSRRALDERARPFHKYLAVWLSGLGVQCIHSGLAARDDRGLLFVGSGGSGKTTSSIACFRGGLDYLGDDFLGIAQDADTGFLGYGLYASCLVNSQHLKRFPDLDAAALPPHHKYEEKSVVFLGQMAPGQMNARVAIGGIVLPRVVGVGETTFRPATKAEALLSLAPSSIMSLPLVLPGALDRLAALVETVPAYWLELGADTDAIVGTVNRIFDTLGEVSLAGGDAG